MRRTTGSLVAGSALLIALAGPVSAHNVTVTPPGGEEKHGWVGALNVPGRGAGLIPGGPDGTWTLTPAHAKGLVAACESTQANPSAVDIRGPGGPGCPHGE